MNRVLINRYWWAWCLVLINVFSLSYPIQVFPADQIIVTADKQLELADTLFKDGEFAAAANEYIRFFYLFPENDWATRARFQAGVSLFYAGRPQDAARHLEYLARGSMDKGAAKDAMFKLSQIYTAMGKPEMAVAVLKNLITLTESVTVKDRACFMLGWVLLDKSQELAQKSAYPMHPVKQARQYFSKISPKGKKTYHISSTIERLEGMENIKKKRPLMSGILSIIPGAGFFYCERYRDAVVGFLLNASLIFAAYEAFENDNPYLGGAITFVETGFYTGNIYGSISSAHKFNRNKQTQFIDGLKKEYERDQTRVKILPTASRESIGLTFRYVF